jgi:thioesterase domain-containing protein
VRTVYLFAEENYMPAGLFDGNLALFRATHGEGNDEPYIERYEDPLLGWGRRAIREVVVHDVPGGHSSMLQEPNVQVLAEQLQMAIDNALADVADSAHELASSDTRKQSSQRVPTIR